MDEQVGKTFPPKLIVDNRVWTEQGYLNHGQLEGPKIDIAPNQGGTIADAREASHFISGSMLYTVRWDDGKISKHYADELFCIGRFQTRKEFEAAIKPTGAVELTLGPASGFRSVRLDLEYDGQVQTATISKQDKRLSACGNSKCFRRTASVPKSRGAQRRYNAFLPHGWTFGAPRNRRWNRFSGAELTITTGCYGRNVLSLWSRD
jgi:hypothetical protein